MCGGREKDHIVNNTMLLGDRPGQPVLQLGFAMSAEQAADDLRPVYGFDLHAGVRIPAREHKRLERLCQYILRPPVAHDRLTHFAYAR